jgi:hypothetical protein
LLGLLRFLISFTNSKIKFYAIFNLLVLLFSSISSPHWQLVFNFFLIKRIVIIVNLNFILSDLFLTFLIVLIWAFLLVNQKLIFLIQRLLIFIGFFFVTRFFKFIAYIYQIFIWSKKLSERNIIIHLLNLNSRIDFYHLLKYLLLVIYQ